MYERSRSEGFGREVKRRILLGTYVLSAGYYDAYYRKAQQVRALLRRDFEEAFASCDALLTPTAPETAFAIGERTADPLRMYLSDVYTVSVNLAGVPALSLPCGFARRPPRRPAAHRPRRATTRRRCASPTPSSAAPTTTCAARSSGVTASRR